MNKLYLMKDEKRNYCLFKVGFAKDLQKRVYQYTTHNPAVECISFLQTMEKTGRTLEKTFHEEIEKMGYEFISATIDGKQTEWFKVSYEDKFFDDLCEKGLNAFKSGKNRKNYGVYVKCGD